MSVLEARSSSMPNVPHELSLLTSHLSDALRSFEPEPPVAHVYRPLDYAASVHEEWIERYGRGRRRVLLVGMNPGPWGMAQTGIPFGAVSAVTGFLDLAPRAVEPPRHEHPKKPVRGFDCHREEVSGRRLWQWAEERFSTPQRFFSTFWVTNYCPLLFLDEEGRNLTPDKLTPDARRVLERPCDEALAAIAELLEVEMVIGIGVWAEARAKIACHDLDVSFGRILHPSPASPLANRGWAPEASRQLESLGIELPLPAAG